MELWGAGFNTNGQLRILDEDLDISGSGDNVFQFKKIASGERLQVMLSAWSQTILFTDGRIVVHGSPLCAMTGPPSFMDEGLLHDQESRYNGTSALLPQITTSHASEPPTSAFGTDSHGLQGFIDPQSGSLWTINPAITGNETATSHGRIVDPSSIFMPALRVVDESIPRLAAVAITSAGTTAAAFHPEGPTFDVRVFYSIADLLRHMALVSTSITSSSMPSDLLSEHNLLGCPAQLVAAATSFVLLISDGNVWTWGDARYPHPLGRQGDAEQPGLVDALVGCRIVKVAAGGWMTGCVSEAGEAWIWGSRAPGEDGEGDEGVRELEQLAGLDVGEITRIELPVGRSGSCIGSEDGVGEIVDPAIVDMAIGDAHVLVLDELGGVWGCGRNQEGQLGIVKGRSGGQPLAFEKHWVKLEAFISAESEKFKIRSVACGNLTSFALLEKTSQT